MSRKGSSALSLLSSVASLVMASLASAVALFGNNGVFLAVFVALGTMCFCLLFFARRQPASHMPDRTMKVPPGQNLFKSVPPLGTSDDGSPTNRGFINQFMNAVFNAFNKNMNSIRSVARIFLACDPSAVIRGIWPIVINSINLVFLGRPGRHIRNKCTKGISPLGADKNSPVAVCAKPWVFWIRTATFHIEPNIIKLMGGVFHYTYPFNAPTIQESS